jgi:hypothetical protein
VPAPVLKSFAQRIYDDLAPLAAMDAGTGYDLAAYVGALGEAFQIVDDLARDQVLAGGKIAPGWSQAVDITRCPPNALPWLAQFVGVVVPPSLSDSDTRNYILNAGGWKRGTAASMTAAVQALLTGNKTVIFSERNGTNDTVNTFEAGTESYTALVSATLTQDAANFRGGGAHSLKTVTGTGANSGMASANVAFAASYNQAMRFSFLGTAGQTYRIYLYDVTHSAVIGSIISHVGLGTWEEVAFWRVCGAVAGNLQLRIDNGASGVAQTFYVDDVHFQQNGPYSLTVITRTAETPNSAAVQAALIAQKPAGILLTYATTTGNTYLELRASQSTYTTARSAYATYQAMRGY